MLIIEYETIKEYIGQTGRRVSDRIIKHRRDVLIKKHDKSGVAEHLCQPGRTVRDLQIIPIRKLHTGRESVRRAKEQHFILALFYLPRQKHLKDPAQSLVLWTFFV